MFPMLCYTSGQMNGEEQSAVNVSEGELVFASVVGLVIAGVIALLLVSWIHSKAASAGIQATLPWQPSRSAS